MAQTLLTGDELVPVGADHPAVLECAVVGREDADGLIKTAAYVVTVPGASADDSLVRALQEHVKHLLAPYKYPRSITFVDELPKTATGKIQRFKLRDLETQRLFER